MEKSSIGQNASSAGLLTTASSARVEQSGPSTRRKRDCGRSRGGIRRCGDRRMGNRAAARISATKAGRPVLLLDSWLAAVITEPPLEAPVDPSYR